LGQSKYSGHALDEGLRGFGRAAIEIRMPQRERL